ncbi:integrase core domain-containing protein, partial [Aeromonas veronii]
RQVLSQRHVERLTIVRACLFLGISRQAYYKRNRVADERHAQGLQVVHFVRQVRLRQPRVGTRKLHYLLQGQDDGGLKVGRDRLFRILAEHRLLVQPKRAYHKTTHSFHRFYRHPNLLKAGPEQVTPVAPEQVWVADITYLPARSGPLYLSLVTDGYDCYQNALAERVNGILKGELLLQSPQDLMQAREMVREAVDIHNTERPHYALKYRTPDAVHRGF